MRVNVKKEDVEKFNNSEIGKVKNHYLKRVKIIGILCIMVGLSWLIISIFNKNQLYDYIISSTLVLFGIYFIINSKVIKNKEVNKYIYNNKKSK